MYISEALCHILKVFVKKRATHSLLRSFTVEPSAAVSYTGVHGSSLSLLNGYCTRSSWLSEQILDNITQYLSTYFVVQNL
jgi:hypothetical protein